MEKKKLRGFSILELLIVSLLLSIVILGTYVVFFSSYSALAAWEIYNRLKIEGQFLLNEEIGVNLSKNKRIFGCERRGNPCNCYSCQYLRRILGSLPPHLRSLEWCRLPEIRVRGVLSPSQEGFDPTIFGNSLLFAAIAEEGSVTVNLTNPNRSEVVKIDLFRFFYYYLSHYPRLPIAQKSNCLNLVEYRSVLYADYQRLIEIREGSGEEKLSKVIEKLREKYSLEFAWDYTAKNPDDAFFHLDTSLSPDSNHQIIADKVRPLLSEKIGGVLGSRGKYSICYNTDSPEKLKSLHHKVPAYGTWTWVGNPEFPGGFELGIVGHSGGREVHFRLVLISETIGGVHSNKTEVTHTVRDVW